MGEISKEYVNFLIKCLSVFQSVFLFVCLSLYPSVYPSVCLSYWRVGDKIRSHPSYAIEISFLIRHSFIDEDIGFNESGMDSSWCKRYETWTRHLSVCRFSCLSLCLSISPYLWLCLYVCMSLCVCLTMSDTTWYFLSLSASHVYSFIYILVLVLYSPIYPLFQMIPTRPRPRPRHTHFLWFSSLLNLSLFPFPFPASHMHIHTYIYSSQTTPTRLFLSYTAH